MRLTDCFMEVMAYVAYFLRGVEKKQPPYDQVRTNVLRLLTESERCLKNARFDANDYDLARFAVCAWVDEAILSSPWEHRARWQTEQLQRVFYGTTEAGEEFFEKLNNIGLHQDSVREVYYLCLALGFKGRYIHETDEYLLEQVRASNVKLLLGSSVGVPSFEHLQLFPEAYPSGEAEWEGETPRRRLDLFTVLGLATPVVLFVLLYGVYRFVLDGVASALM